MSKFSPTRSDLRFRLAFSAAGLIMLVAALVFRGLPTTAGGWEAIGLATVFFAGTLVWTLRKLLRKEYGDAP